MRKIQIGCRLIQKNNTGLLGKRHGNPHALPLPTGKTCYRTRAEIPHAGHRKRPFHNCLVLCAELSDSLLIRKSAVCHKLLAGERSGRRRCLRQNRHLLCNIFVLHFGNPVSADDDTPRFRANDPPNGLEHGGFSAPVCTDHRRDLSCTDLNIKRRHDDMSVISNLQFFRNNSFVCFLCLHHQDLIKRYRKYGTESTETMIPVGILASKEMPYTKLSAT